MGTPATGLNLANLEKSWFPLHLDPKNEPPKIPIYRDRATGKVVAINLNSVASIACSLSVDAMKSRLSEIVNKNEEIKQVNIY